MNYLLLVLFSHHIVTNRIVTNRMQKYTAVYNFTLGQTQPVNHQKKHL